LDVSGTFQVERRSSGLAYLVKESWPEEVTHKGEEAWKGSEEAVQAKVKPGVLPVSAPIPD